MRNPRRWWKYVRKLGMTGGRVRSDIGKVYEALSEVKHILNCTAWRRARNR